MSVIFFLFTFHSSSYKSSVYSVPCRSSAGAGEAPALYINKAKPVPYRAGFYVSDKGSEFFSFLLVLCGRGTVYRISLGIPSAPGII